MNTCRIVEDLMPLYIDDACSQDSVEFIEAHIADCPACRSLLIKMRAGENVSDTSPGIAALKTISARLSRMKLRSRLKGLIIGSAVVALTVLLLIAATQLMIFAVPAERIEISDVCCLPDGNIAFHMYIADDRDLHAVTYEVTADGDMYITPKRALIKDRRRDDIACGLYDMDFAVDISADGEAPLYSAFYFGIGDTPQSIYAGTEGDCVLIWEQGMELPPADEGMIELFTPSAY